MKRQHSKALSDAKVEKIAPPPKKAKKDSKSSASYGADCAPEVPAAEAERDKAFADSLVALAPDLGLVAKKAFGHLGLQREGIFFAWVGEGSVGVRPFKAAHRPLIAEMGCTVVDDPSGFHSKNPYYKVPKAVTSDSKKWTKLVLGLTDAETLQQQLKKKEARNKSRAKSSKK